MLFWGRIVSYDHIRKWYKVCYFADGDCEQQGQHLLLIFLEPNILRVILTDILAHSKQALVEGWTTQKSIRPFAAGRKCRATRSWS
jgi:hypothetical protein